MTFKVAQINKLEDGWEIKVGDGETADFSLFVKDITVSEGEDVLSLNDILNELQE